MTGLARTAALLRGIARTTPTGRRIAGHPLGRFHAARAASAGIAACRGRPPELCRGRPPGPGLEPLRPLRRPLRLPAAAARPPGTPGCSRGRHCFRLIPASSGDNRAGMPPGRRGGCAAALLPLRSGGRGLGGRPAAGCWPGQMAHLRRGPASLRSGADAARRVGAAGGRSGVPRRRERNRRTPRPRRRHPPSCRPSARPCRSRRGQFPSSPRRARPSVRSADSSCATPDQEGKGHVAARGLLASTPARVVAFSRQFIKYDASASLWKGARFPHSSPDLPRLPPPRSTGL